MRFSITHPLVDRPHHPDLVTGPGVSNLARHAEAVGFDAYGFTDHPAPSQRWLESGGHDALDPFAALGFVAAATGHLRLLPNIVVLPYRNPFLVAKAGATLDALSGGRFILSTGAGYLRSEFRALGVDPDERAGRFEEALTVIRAIWTSDELTHEGPHFSARSVTAHPRPTTRPHPPIWIGGNSGAARRRVVEHGDGWAPFPAPPQIAGTSGTATLDTIDGFARAVDDLRRRLDDADRDPATVDISFSCLAGGNPGDDDFDADAQIENVAQLADLGVTWIQVPLPGDSPARAQEAMDRYAEAVIGPLRAAR